MNPQAITIPFVLAEGPRIFLQWLALNSTLPDAARKKIAEWVLNYNRHLAMYIEAQYGHPMTHAANDLSVHLAQVFMREIAEEREHADSEMFSRLEDEIFGGDGA